jgi:hypothetical protein
MAFKMKKLILFLLFCGVAQPQCTLWNQTTCSAVLAGSYTPTLGSFLANTNASFKKIQAATAALPQPKITITGQNWPCEGGTLRSSVTTYGPHCEQFSGNILAAAGVTTQDYNIWQLAMASSYEYSLNPGVGAYNIVGDCPSGQTHPGYLTYLETPLGNATANPHCWALHYYDITFANMISHGWVIRAGDPQLTDELQACGLGSTPWVRGTIASPVITLTQYEGCLLPLHRAEIARWPAITAFQVQEEPTAGGSAVQVFSVADESSFIVADSTQLKAVNSNGLKIGAATTGLSWPLQFDNAYLADWTNSSSATYTALDFYVFDIFNASCDPSTGNSQFSGQVYYAAELAAWTGSFGATSAGPYGFITQALTTGKPWRVGQADAPFWCLTSTTVVDQSADILGQYNIIWNTSWLFNEWLSTFVPWVSAHGGDGVSIFFTAPLGYYSTNNSDDNAATESGTTAMANLAPTNSAYWYKQIGAWSNTSLQGLGHLSGKAHLGH